MRLRILYLLNIYCLTSNDKANLLKTMHNLKYSIPTLLDKLDIDSRKIARRAMEDILGVTYVQVSRLINAKIDESTSISFEKMELIKEFFNNHFADTLGVLELKDFIGVNNQQPKTKERA